MNYCTCDKLFEDRKEKITAKEENDINNIFGFEPSICDFLKKYSGAYLKEGYEYKGIEPTCISVDGYDSITNIIEISGENGIQVLLECYREQIPDNMLPIAEIDGGNLLLLHKKTGKIYQWIHDDEKQIYLSANSFSEIIDKMELREELKDNMPKAASGQLSADFFDALFK